MKNTNSLSGLIFFVVIIPFAILTYYVYNYDEITKSIWIGSAGFVFGLIAANALKIAQEWERALVLRFGKFKSLKGPGLFFIIPIIDTIPYVIDLRVITTSFKAEKTLTKDTVPVDVDAVLFWKVIDSKKAALEVEDYKTAISWASQTALRDVIGKTMLADMLEGRDKLDSELQKIIDKHTKPWGINVSSVEIRDVLIPHGLQDAMSMQAQAERERQARVILGDSERQIAEKFEEASRTYADNPTALHLRAMNMLYEGMKQNGSLIIVPSSAIETMQLGAVSGVAALSNELIKRNAKDISGDKDTEEDVSSNNEDKN